ncbi:MAG: MBL fold metallo-hydrolase [Oscillospiraceae bacterium]|nr:MBL fold metallo-hydrolase [Oscillospiraceae bacterium]MCL2279271.1 MBL fold metallo-hydrolase [Oscillospiraceae bacterium]
MLIKTLPVGMLETNCYILTDEVTAKCAIIDPGAESNTILDYIESNKLTPAAIFITHGHFDHFMALEELVKEIDVPVYIHENDFDRKGQGGRHQLSTDSKLNFYKEADEIEVGNLTVKVLETPGHSPGSVTLMCEDALFTGDTLFSGDCGRTDLPGGSREIILQSLKRLAELNGNFEVYPGHDESTTLENERKFNRDILEAIK